MSFDSERTVPAGAIATAMTMVESLHGRDNNDPEGTLEAVLAGIDEWGHATIVDAFGTLIYTAMNIGEWPDDTDPLHMLVPAVVAKFRRMQLPEVPTEVLPTVAGVLTAACLQLDPLQWRLELGTIPASEPMVWCFTAWLLVDLLDQVMFGGREGAFAEILREVLLTDPDDPTDGQTQPAPAST